MVEELTPRVESFRQELDSHGYELMNQIGAGGFASVWLVKSRQYDIIFVAKIIDLQQDTHRNLPDSFESEISALVNIIHPNVISIFDHFTVEDSLFLILEYCSGGTVEDIIRREGKIAPPQLYTICQEVISALTFCESMGIAHRDIKPSNLLIDKYGRIKLADFGFAQHFQHSELSRRFTGSLPFMPPEVLKLNPYDPIKADIWSLGITFYLMATGAVPWKPKSPTHLAMLISTKDLEFPPYIDPDFARIVTAMLTVNPKERPSLLELSSEHIIFHAEKKLRKRDKSNKKIKSAASSGSLSLIFNEKMAFAKKQHYLTNTFY